MNSFNYSTYLSPFTTRYGSEKMRGIWSEIHKRKLWRKMWVALARAESKHGLVSQKEFADISSHEKDIDIERSREIEKDIYHELMSEILCFSEQCKVGGGKIHLGATSTDIIDNATIIQIHSSLGILRENLTGLLKLFSEKITEYQDTVCMGYTHLQPAEPTTLGYRLSFYAQDLLMDLTLLDKMQPLIKGKGVKGAVGTSASFVHILGSSQKALDLERDVMTDVGIDAVTVATQTYPRKIDLLVVQLLSQIAASLHKFAFDYRIMQQPSIGEWMEKRDSKRVGSSAMPFKRNPDKAEKVCSLCRHVASLVTSAWSNPAMTLLERTLDDSANQRLFLPEGFLAIDECLSTAKALLEKLQVNTQAVEKNLSLFGQFAAIEPLLMELTKKGADRQNMHEVLKGASMQVWEARDGGKPIDLFSLLSKEKGIIQYVSPKELAQLINPHTHIGRAKEQTTLFLKELNKLKTKT